MNAFGKRTSAESTEGARVVQTLAPDDPRHGTTGGYTNHFCRCDRCRQANTERHRAWRHRTGFAQPRDDYLAEISSVRSTTLKCSRCKHWRVDNEFPGRAANEHRRGRHEWCTACNTAWRRERRQRLSDAEREALRTYDRERKNATRAALSAALPASRGMSTPNSSRVSAENHRAPDGETEA